MNQISREQVAAELAKLATLLQHEAVSGCLIIAVHEQNDSATVILAPPDSKLGVDRLMSAIDRTVFRAKVALYLKPDGKRAPIVARGSDVPQ